VWGKWRLVEWGRRERAHETRSLSLTPHPPPPTPPTRRHMYASSCAVGFSAVLFAFKAVLNADDPSTSSIMGIPVPTRFMAWGELLLASAFNPQASFFGHVCGILAGLAHVQVARALARPGGRRVLRRAAGAVQWLMEGPGRPRFSGGGAAGGYGDANGGARGAGGRAAAGGGTAAFVVPPRPVAPAAAARAPAPPPAPASAPAAAAAGSGSGAAGGGRRAAVGVNGPDVAAAVVASHISADELRRRRLARFG
jgi:hypothetical protein